MSVPYYPQITITPNLGMSLVGMDVEVAENFIILDAAVGQGGSSSIQINGSVVSNPNFNNTVPAPPAGFANVVWQTDGSGNVSGYMPLGASTATLFLDQAASDISTYYQLINSYPTSSQTSFSVSGNAGAGQVLIAAFATAANFPSATLLPQGMWVPSFYASVDSLTQNPQVIVNVYKRSAAGVETLLGTVSVLLTSTAITFYDTSFELGATQVATTDRLVLKFYLLAGGASTRTVTLYLDGNVNTSHIHLPLSVGNTLSSGSMLQISNDNNLIWPTPQLNQYSPKYQYMPVGVSGTEGNATLTSNVLTVNVNHGYQVGETVTFTSVTGNYAFLNNVPIVVTGVTPPSSATITNIAVAGQTVTVTANNTFNAHSNDVVKFSGLTTNSWANGMTVSVTTANATQFTFQWTAAIPAPFTPGAETGTATELLNSAFTANFTHANVATNVLAGGYCGTTVQPFLWMYDTFNQKWIDYAYVDSSVPAPGDPTLGSFAKLAFSRPVQFTDGTSQFSGIRQAGPVSIYHVTGNNENLVGADYFDVTLGIATDQFDSKVYSNIHQIYCEHRIKGAPILSPLATETAVTGLRMTVPDQHTNTWNVTWVAAVNGIWNTIGGSNPNPFASGQAVGVLGQSNNGNSNAGAGGTFVGVLGNSSGVAAAANAVGIGVRAQSSGHAVNYGVYIDAVSTGAGGLKGYNLVSFNGNVPNSGYASFWGNIVLPDTYSGIRLARFGDGAAANSDVAGKLSFSAATTASYTFLNSYSTTPMVFICPENPGQVQFSITTISTTGFTITASASFTGNVSYFIIGRN